MSNDRARKREAFALQRMLSCGYQPALNIVLAAELEDSGLDWAIRSKITAATQGRADRLGGCLARAWTDVLPEANRVIVGLKRTEAVLRGLEQYGVAAPVAQRVQRAWAPFARNASEFVAACDIARTAILLLVQPLTASGLTSASEMVMHAWKYGPPPIAGAPVEHPEISAALNALRTVSRTLLSSVATSDEVSEALLSFSLEDERAFLIDTLHAVWTNRLIPISAAWYCSGLMDTSRWELQSIGGKAPNRWTAPFGTWTEVHSEERPYETFSPRYLRAKHPIETYIP